MGYPILKNSAAAVIFQDLTAAIFFLRDSPVKSFSKFLYLTSFKVFNLLKFNIYYDIILNKSN